MATLRELQNEYHKILNTEKDFPSSTLSKWVKEKRIRAEKLEDRTYNYNLEDFVNIISSEQYQSKVRAKKENPKDYIGKQVNHLLITGIVPKEEYEENYKGTLMYCDCLNCGKKHIQVRFSLLTPSGNYHQESCGCLRKVYAFLHTKKSEQIKESFIFQFSNDFDKFLFIHKMIMYTSGKKITEYTQEEYEQTINYFYNNEQFNAVYEYWNTQPRSSTFYDLAKPSLDHIIPKTKNGSNHYSNLQVLTVFENLAKRDMTQEEWDKFKKDTNTTSNYFIENILEWYRGREVR